MEKKRLTHRSMVFVLAGGRGSRLKELTDQPGEAGGIFWWQDADHRLCPVECA